MTDGLTKAAIRSSQIAADYDKRMKAIQSVSGHQHCNEYVLMLQVGALLTRIEELEQELGHGIVDGPEAG